MALMMLLDFHIRKYLFCSEFRDVPVLLCIFFRDGVKGTNEIRATYGLEDALQPPKAAHIAATIPKSQASAAARDTYSIAENVTVPIRFAFSSKVNGEYNGTIASPNANEINESRASERTTSLCAFTEWFDLLGIGGLTGLWEETYGCECS